MKVAALISAALLAVGTGVYAGAGTSGIVVKTAASQPPLAGPAENFIGKVTVGSRFQPVAPSRAGGGLVKFAAGARTAWHSHPLGQTLVVTEGSGRVQHWGGPVRTIETGDVAWIPPGVKHWHGAGETSAMAHVAIAEALDGRSVTWMEQVSDEQYSKAD